MHRPAPLLWACVTVDDIDATVALVEESGGRVIVRPTDIPETGRFSVFSDPQGSVISAITCSRRCLSCRPKYAKLWRKRRS